MRQRLSSNSPAWSKGFQPPPPLAAQDWHLTPLHPDLSEVDYQAWKSCRERLVRELDWNGWPGPEFSLEENRLDLAEHYREFEDREAYAYSVLSGEDCVGCLYIEPWSSGAQLAFWFRDDWLPRETEVIEAVLKWLEGWPFDEVLLPLRPWNARKLAAVQALGLRPCAGPEGHVSHTQQRRPGGT